MAMSDKHAAHRSAIQVCFPSVLMTIDTFCQLKSTECYKIDLRTLSLANTCHDRFSDGSTDNTSHGQSIRIAE